MTHRIFIQKRDEGRVFQGFHPLPVPLSLQLSDGTSNLRNAFLGNLLSGGTSYNTGTQNQVIQLSVSN